MSQSPAAADDVDVIFEREVIDRRIAELANEIAAARFRDLLVVSILKGSFIFSADLIRALHGAGLAPEIEFLFLSSYGTGTTSSGQVAVVRDVETDVRGRDVLLVDDILESGRTLAFAKQYLQDRGANRVACCVLLEKPGLRKAKIEADFRGFECPDVFVVGYGMDLGHRYRELPFVGKLAAR